MNPCVISRHPVLAHGTVSQLMHIDRKQWDLEVLHDLFEIRDIEFIMQVPLSYNVHVDSWFWGKESNGFYSVKSSYRYFQELKGEWGVQLESDLWKVLWKVKVPPKVLHFAWKAISGCLPTRTQLRTKHVPVDPRCVFCNSDEETIFHVLAFLSGGRVALVDELLMVAWGIWKARNELLWQGRSSQAADVVRVARSCHSSWLLAQENRFEPLLFDATVVGSSVFWVKPPAGMLKINTDGAIFEATTQYAVAEVLSVKEALSWLKSKNLSNVLVETDCIVVVQALNSSVALPSVFAAHCVARGACFWSDRLFTESNVPHVLQSIVLADIAV
ncbi:uncharacterized protein LOC115725496 [Cannabis sativa]|uniref:uncharacterized protein LOC115725496 n=1 Tax=Cannabis sativa TaxID=3483 RepID=UPI0029CA792C|nr:uncharacterized protein LOC115725496 [Cannabis sativa]